MMLLTALGAAVVMVSNTETMIAGNYRNSQEALYAADAAVERVVQDLLMVPRWNDILAGTVQSSLHRRRDDRDRRRCPAAARWCSAAAPIPRPAQLQADDRHAEPVGRQQPAVAAVRLGAAHRHAAATSRSTARCTSPSGLPTIRRTRRRSDPDGNPLADANGTLTLHAEAFGPAGTRKVIEVTVARTSSTEIERGQIAQRGQEELNQRARKAAVQTPGKSLTNMRMNTSTGNLVVQ